MLAQSPPHPQFIPASANPTYSRLQCSQSPNMPNTFSSNTYLLSVSRPNASASPMVNVTCSNQKGYPNEPPLVKTPRLYISSSVFCKSTSRSQAAHTNPALSIPIQTGGSNDCAKGPISEQLPSLPPQADLPNETLSQGSLETLNPPSLEPINSDPMEMIPTPPSSDSRSIDSTDYASPVHELRSVASLLAEPDVIMDRHANPLPLFTSGPIKPWAPFTPFTTYHKVHHKVRKCATLHCDGFLAPTSTCLRCVKCIRADWTDRKARGLSLSNKRHSGLVPILRHDYSEKAKRKSVSWADQEYDWISKIKRVRLKLPEQLSSARSIDERTVKAGLPKQSELPQLTQSTSSPSKPKDSSPLDSCIWDSDLSELTESSEESDSESEESKLYSSSLEEASDSESECESPKLVIRIPAPRPYAGNVIPAPTPSGRNKSPVVSTPYPEYRSQSDLLADFRTRVSGFQEALSIHSMYMRRGNQISKSVFGFEGQYSVVAPDWNLFGRKESIQSDVLDLKERLGKREVIEFDGNTTITINENGIFMGFLCAHRVYDPLGPFYTDQEPRIMQGELEIAALPDNSHHILPGQRFVIRFRMVG